MTYGVGILLEGGLVFASDSRTNAGVDQVSTFRKMTVWERPGERVLVMLTAGNLSLSQGVIHLLDNGMGERLHAAATMVEAARVVGEAVREVEMRDGEALRRHHTDFNLSLIFGGQIAGERPRLFNIYAAGNFIEASPETPYFQIGEIKYGKPILDRVITQGSSVAQATKCALISFDSTIRSNLSVGLPIDLACVERDQLRARRRSVGEDDAYFAGLRRHWSDGLRRVFSEMPDPG
jgi:putative proteasome-type protease